MTAITHAIGLSINCLYVSSRSLMLSIDSCEPTENWFGCNPSETSRNRETLTAMCAPPVSDATVSRDGPVVREPERDGENGETTSAARRGDERPVARRIDACVDQPWTSPISVERGAQFVGRTRDHAVDAAGPCDRGEVGLAVAHGVVPTVMVALFDLDQAQRGVVEHDDRDGQIQSADRFEFGHGHAQSTISHERDDGTAGARHG